MFKSKYVKYVALSALLGLFVTMFGTIGDFQNHALAQITPAPEKAGGSSSSDQSSSNNPSSDGHEGGTDSSESSSSNDDSESQDISEEEGTGSDSGESNPLMEQIINKVKQDFAAAGLSSLDW
jgi:cytoskeletal protein RodZ